MTYDEYWKQEYLSHGKWGYTNGVPNGKKKANPLSAAAKSGMKSLKSFPKKTVKKSSRAREDLVSYGKYKSYKFKTKLSRMKEDIQNIGASETEKNLTKAKRWLEDAVSETVYNGKKVATKAKRAVEDLIEKLKNQKIVTTKTTHRGFTTLPSKK